MLSIIKPAFILGLSLLTIIRNKERDYKKTIKNVRKRDMITKLKI